MAYSLNVIKIANPFDNDKAGVRNGQPKAGLRTLVLAEMVIDGEIWCIAVPCTTNTAVECKSSVVLTSATSIWNNRAFDAERVSMCFSQVFRFRKFAPQASALTVCGSINLAKEDPSVRVNGRNAEFRRDFFRLAQQLKIDSSLPVAF